MPSPSPQRLSPEASDALRGEHVLGWSRINRVGSAGRIGGLVGTRKRSEGGGHEQLDGIPQSRQMIWAFTPSRLLVFACSGHRSDELIAQVPRRDVIRVNGTKLGRLGYRVDVLLPDGVVLSGDAVLGKKGARAAADLVAAAGRTSASGPA